MQKALEDLDTFKDESTVRLAEMYRTQRTQPTVEDENLSVVESPDVSVSCYYSWTVKIEMTRVNARVLCLYRQLKLKLQKLLNLCKR